MNTQAAQSLVERAMQAEKESEVNLLLGAAKTLDSSIPTVELKRQWLEKWLIKTQQERNIPNA